jgi:phosphoglycerate dehydrogenase-like enzyme
MTPCAYDESQTMSQTGRFDAIRRPAWLAVLLLAVTLLPSLAMALSASPDPRAAALIQELGLKSGAIAARDQPGWAVPKRIVVGYDDPALLQQLQAVAPAVEILTAAAEPAARAEQLASAQAVFGLCNAPTLEAARELHWIQALSVGVERCVVLPGLVERGIVLTNMQRTSGVPIADHAIAMTLALTRGLPQFIRQQQSGHWADQESELPVMREISGRTMLLVGLGGIGTEVGRRAHGLGMQVIAIRNSSREGPDFVARVGLPEELLAFAAQADVVVNSVPLTPETTGLFNAEFFAAMPNGSYFISVGRGQSTVTDALVDALRSGHLAGAGLDVTDPEPLPEGHALWAMPNVIITPHVAAVSEAQNQRYWILAAENLRRYVAGEPLLNVVDIQRGY